MDRHLTPEEVQRIADGELELDDHAGECVRCAAAVAGAQRLKRAVREAMQTEPAPAALRRRLTPRSTGPWWMAAAAAAVFAVLGIAFGFHVRSREFRTELVDMHVTLLAGANPVDVVSTNLHTVRPWFEGRLPFAVPVPDLTSTPFRLIGGRVVFWHEHPAAYLLVGKGAHRISVFVFRDEDAPEITSSAFRGVNIAVWRRDGLTRVAVAEIPLEDLAPLRAAI